MKEIISKILICMLEFYKLCISPIVGSACRYVPTCSEYFKEAIIKYGPLKGFKLGVARLLRCHPFNNGGYDPLP